MLSSFLNPRLSIAMMRNKPKHNPSETPPAAPLEGGETAPADATTAKPAEEPAPVDERLVLQQALDASKDQYVRLLADFDNFRRRTARERQETIKRAGEDILADLLPVVDHFELALAQAADPADSFVAGMKMVYDQLIATLAKAGLVAVNAQGKTFDPREHEAIAYQPSPEVAEGYVLLQTRCGYRLGDRVIRPAAVIVSSGAPQPAPPGEAADAEPAADEPDAAGPTDAADTVQ
jgi:molecular chaperone GrpE